MHHLLARQAVRPGVVEVAGLYARRSSPVATHGLFRTYQGGAQRSDIYLAQNSLLFHINHTFLEHGSMPHIVKAPMWLDRVLPVYDDLTWGQTMISFPSTVRGLLKQLFPDLAPDEFVTWGHIKAIREARTDELLSMHNANKLVFHDLCGEVASGDVHDALSLEQTSDVISLSCRGSTIFTLPSSQVARIFNGLSIPRPLGPTVTQELRVKEVLPHTELYCQSKIPEVILAVGAGLSTVWLKKNFPNSQLIVVCYDKTNPLIRIPSNDGVDYDSIVMVEIDDVKRLPDSENLAVVYNDGSPIAFDPQVSTFSTAGYDPHASLTDGIEHDIVTIDHVDLRDWTAPRNIPKGSLTARLMGYYALLGNDPCSFYELQYFDEDITPTVLQCKFRKQDIELPEAFFDVLARNIRELSDPLTAEDELELYLGAFQKAGGDFCRNSEEPNRFLGVIRALQDEISNRESLGHRSPQSLQSIRRMP